MKYSKVNQSVTTIVIMGFLSLVSQTLILREIIIQFQGNELTIGIILANWLIFEAIGAYFTGYFIKNKNILKTAVILQIVLIISLIWAYLFISKFKIVFKFGFGESLGIYPTLLIPMIALVFLCIPLGFQFSLSCNILNKFLKFKKGAYNIAHSYFLEAIGWFLGGLVFNFILIYFFNNLQILFIILMLSTANLILYLNIRKKHILRDFFIITLSFLILFLFLKFDIKINKYLNKMNSNYKLLNIENSKYGKIHVIKNNNQVNIYQNGILTYSSDDILKNEEIIHLTLLRKPYIEKVALIGGGLTNGINEILKYPNIKKVYYCELDPKIIKLCKKYYKYPYYKNKKVEIFNTDGRYFIKHFTQKKLDAVIINLPDPSTAQLNRYYTYEFFSEVKNILNNRGIISLNLTSSEDYISDTMKRFNISILNSMNHVYESLDTIPGINLIVIGYKNHSPVITKDILINNLQHLTQKNKYVNDYYLRYRIDDEKLRYFKSIINNRDSEILNEDFNPVTYYYFFSRWSSIFKSKTNNFFNFLNSFISFKSIFILVTILFVIKLFIKIFKNENIDLVSISFYIGFSGMALQLILIYAYQAFYGYIYTYISMLTAFYMSGMATGSYHLNSKLKIESYFEKYIKKMLIILSLIIIILPSLLHILYDYNFLSLVSFPIFTFINGFFTGSIFTSLNKIWLKKKQSISFIESGTFYSLDLLGGAGSALLSSIVFIPLLGLEYYSFILGYTIFLNYILFKL